MKKLDNFLAGIEKKHGVGAVFASSSSPIKDLEWILTDINSINDALGAGIPCGRIIEVVGAESAGKTTLCLELIKNAQKYKKDKNTAYIDSEHALDLEYIKNLGIDLDRMPISQPETAEEVFRLLFDFVDSGLFSVIVVDSVAAMTPRAEADGDVGDQHLGLLARLMSQNLKKLAKKCNDTQTTVIFINQIRLKIGVHFGNPETTPGGKALKYYSSIRIDIRKKETIVDGNKPIGIQSRIKVVKNKCARPFADICISIIFGKGIDVGADILETLKKQERVTIRGSHYFLDGAKNYNKDKSPIEDSGLKIGIGKNKAFEWLKDNFSEYDKKTKKDKRLIGYAYSKEVIK